VRKEVDPVGEYFSMIHIESFFIVRDALKELIPKVIPFVATMVVVVLGKNKASFALAKHKAISQNVGDFSGLNMAKKVKKDKFLPISNSKYSF